MKLEYPRGEPNFFEMHIKNPDRNFKLILRPKKESEPVWNCTVRGGGFGVTSPELNSSLLLIYFQFITKLIPGQLPSRNVTLDKTGEQLPL